METTTKIFAVWPRTTGRIFAARPRACRGRPAGLMLQAYACTGDYQEPCTRPAYGYQGIALELARIEARREDHYAYLQMIEECGGDGP